MSQTAPVVKPFKLPAKPIPPLTNGDHLNRVEFERRFDATPNLKKAELIEGKVYVAPPVSHRGHGSPHVDLIGLFFIYRAATLGIMAGDNSSIRLDPNNMPQPDVFLFIDPALGGQAKIDPQGYMTGAPELIAEIAATSASYDLYEKFDVYRRHGVKEYIVWRTLDGALDYFILRQGDYQQLPPRPDGALCSETFPGLWIDPVALLTGDLAKALSVLQQGLASPEHTAFADSLKAKIKP